jgi:hypothetical protein
MMTQVVDNPKHNAENQKHNTESQKQFAEASRKGDERYYQLLEELRKKKE